jgi:hypothetical protein
VNYTTGNGPSLTTERLTPAPPDDRRGRHERPE